MIANHAFRTNLQSDRRFGRRSRDRDAEDEIADAGKGEPLASCRTPTIACATGMAKPLASPLEARFLAAL
jgi:hypothetical protein